LVNSIIIYVIYYFNFIKIFYLFLECWNSEPDNRPTMNQVVERLKSIILNIDLLHNKLPKIIQNFDKTNAKEITESLILLERKFGIIINEIVDIILKELNEGKKADIVKQLVTDYLDNHNINSQVTYNLLLDNQNDSNSIFLLGYFNYYGIITENENYKEAFNLFVTASEYNHILAQYYVGRCYEFGNGVVKNEELAFEYYEKIANQDFALGEYKIGYFYDNGIGTEKDENLAAYWYKKAESNGH